MNEAQNPSNERNTVRTMDTMFFVSWEHEYYTDDDQAMFDTLAEAQAFQVKLQGLGKRRIMIDGPGIEGNEDV